MSNEAPITISEARERRRALPAGWTTRPRTKLWHYFPKASAISACGHHADDETPRHAAPGGFKCLKCDERASKPEVK